jgi:hypothetical protein
MSETPCLCSSPITLSIAGALSPSGSGNHGFDKTSPIAASMLSFDCKIKQNIMINIFETFYKCSGSASMEMPVERRHQALKFLEF